jgi:hypothetical protein
MLLGVSETLRHYLVATIPDTNVKIGAVADLLETSPEKGLLLVLYEIEDLGHIRTAPARLAPETQEPVALKLQYLVTCHAQDARESQQRLSRVLEAFHNHPVFTEGELHSTIANRIGRLTIQLRSGPLADLRNLWTAFGAPMQLSLYYEVNAQPPS